MRSRRVIIILLFALATMATALFASTDVKAKYGKWIDLPTAELVERGQAFLYQEGCPDSALVCFSIAASRYSDALSDTEKQECYKALIGKWRVQFFHYYDFPKAYESLSDALRISEQTGHGRGMANLHLAMMYQMFGTDGRDNNALNSAKAYDRQAFDLALAEGDTLVVHMAFSNLVSLTTEKPELEEIAPYRAAYEAFAEGSDHPIVGFNILLYDINLAIANEDYDRALALLDAQSQYVTTSQPRYLIAVLMSRANVYRLKKEYGSAENMLNQAQQIAESENMKDVLLNIYDEKKRLFVDSGEADKQADAYYSYLSLKDTLLNYKQIAGFTENNFMSEIEKLDLALSQIQYKRKVQGWIVGLCIAIILCLICSMIIILRKNRKLSAANMSLYEKTKELIGKEEEAAGYVRSDTQPAMSAEEQEKQKEMMKLIYGVASKCEELYSPKFTISKFAELVGMQVKPLSKIINEETGENFNGFINRFRIKKACRMLDDIDQYGTLTIENIGLSVGFRSRTAFITAFKKLTGLNPSDYLKAARQAWMAKACPKF